MYVILAHLEPQKSHYKEADFQHLLLLKIFLLTSFIQQKNKANNGTASVNSNYKSSYVASNFMVVCIMLIRRVCMKS